MYRRQRGVLTTGEVADACGVTLAAVKKWIKQGKLQAYQTPGGHFRVTAGEFERFRAAHRVPDLDPARVLVVDDQAEVVDFIMDSLRQTGLPLTLEAASNGYEGLIKVGTFSPDVLLLDLNMPRIDGLEVCRRIKGDPATAATRIIAVTGFPDQFTERAARDAGADAFLIKSFDIRALRTLLRRLLGARVSAR